MSHGSAEGRLLKIWVKRMRLGPMDEHERATLTAGRGIEGNANQRGKRQVTLVERERWQEISEELGVEADPVLRRANLLIEGLRLEGTRGRILRIGPCRLRIGGETRPCRKMEESLPGLQKALDPDWRGGVYAEVLDDAEIAVGDGVSWEA